MFPIPQVNDQVQNHLSILAGEIQSLSSESFSISSKLEDILISEFNDKKIKLKESWWRQDFNNFVTDLKIKINLQQKDQLFSLFTKYKDECSKLAELISLNESEVNRTLYNIFNLDEKEIKLIEQ